MPETLSEIRVRDAIKEVPIGMSPMNAQDIHMTSKQAMEFGRAAIRALRDPPHAVLDLARGNRMASGDALVFWNAMIDIASPPVGEK